jgi:hypothetical protein
MFNAARQRKNRVFFAFTQIYLANFRYKVFFYENGVKKAVSRMWETAFLGSFIRVYGLQKKFRVLLL